MGQHHTSFQVTIDDRQVVAYPGEMIIEVTDREGIYIPRFCYHKHLSIAANCRMCLVEVAKAPKPLPACATPVAPEMVVYTQSPEALKSQKAIMEFLLINHPLDCPICDQGGECELQDLAMGYGHDVSRYNDGKRVVKDEDLGPLIATDMTRCIHCTRCIRFGEEIAGMPELGLTSRGNTSRVGTYLQTGVHSELSGNMLDVCPVGALTSKPFRYRGRSWSFVDHPTVSFHDCLGSNMYAQVVGKGYDHQVDWMRVLPRENEAINQTWLSDRDRFAYAGAQVHRLEQPEVKIQGRWQKVTWANALRRVADHMRQAVKVQQGDGLGALVSPTTTSEDAYVLQKLLRALGSHHIDHRIRQSDFSQQDCEQAFPGLPIGLDELERQDAVLLVGAFPRHEQPLLNHRLRQAALRGAAVSSVHIKTMDWNFPLTQETITPAADFAEALSPYLAAVMKHEEAQQADAALPAWLNAMEADADVEAWLAQWQDADAKIILLGEWVLSHPHYHAIRAMAEHLAARTGAQLGVLTSGPNSAGLWLSGAVPHRVPGAADAYPGKHAQQLIESPAPFMLLQGIDPALDTIDAATLTHALKHQAEYVVSLNAYDLDAIREVADVILPIALPVESGGTYVNVTGQSQTFQSAMHPPGEGKSAWKVYRALGSLLSLDGFEHQQLSDVTADLDKTCHRLAETQPRKAHPDWKLTDSTSSTTSELWLAGHWPMMRSDSCVRHSAPLQATLDATAEHLLLAPDLAERYDLATGDQALLRSGDTALTVSVTVTEGVADGTLSLAAGLDRGQAWGAWVGPVTLEKQHA